MQSDVKRVGVIGLGKLGSPLAATLAAAGLEVIGVDRDASKVDAINRGEAPVDEPGLAALLTQCGKNLRATTDLEAAASACDVTFVIVPTPSQKSGRFDVRFVVDAVEGIGRGLRGTTRQHTVSITSTVMPGHTGGPILEALERASGRTVGRGLGLCYSPEFIALGTVLRDLTQPDLVLVGESDPAAGSALLSVLSRIVQGDPPVRRMSFVDAELAKLALNCFVTTKITFANTLAAVARGGWRGCGPRGRGDWIRSAGWIGVPSGRAWVWGALLPKR